MDISAISSFKKDGLKKTETFVTDSKGVRYHEDKNGNKTKIEKKNTDFMNLKLSINNKDVDKIEVDTINHSFDFNNPEEIEEALSSFREHGYIIAKSVLSKTEIEHAKTLFWNFAERVTAHNPAKSIDRNDVTTWKDINWISDWYTGIVTENGIGQSDLLWYVRTRPSVKKVYSTIWKTDDLLVSFDGCGTFRPWEYEPSWKTGGGWFHVDQNPTAKPGMHCVQGLVSMYDGTRDTGGFTCYPQSHKTFEDMGKRLKISMLCGDYIKMPPSELENRTPRLVTCNAGDMVLWDSRTIHCNYPGVEPTSKTTSSSSSTTTATITTTTTATTTIEKEKSEKEKKWDLIRLVTYVSMSPTKKAKKNIINRRKKGAKDGVTCSHWSTEYRCSSSAPNKERTKYKDSQYLCQALIEGSAKQTKKKKKNSVY